MLYESHPLKGSQYFIARLIPFYLFMYLCIIYLFIFHDWDYLSYIEGTY